MLEQAGPEVVSAAEEPRMEGLIQLVTESLARHGIEPATSEPRISESVRPAEAPLPGVLPEHNYRKTEELALAP